MRSFLEYIEEEQRFSSAGTALSQVPATYKKFDFSNTVILDYGCGKGLGKNYCQSTFDNCVVYNYDPFHGPDERRHFDTAEGNKVICCNNVLNVVEDETLYEILNDIRIIAAKNNVSKIYFKIYEGNKSAVGGQSKENCYQRNEPAKNYVNYVKRVFTSASVGVKKSLYVVVEL